MPARYVYSLLPCSRFLPFPWLASFCIAEMHAFQPKAFWRKSPHHFHSQHGASHSCENSAKCLFDGRRAHRPGGQHLMRSLLLLSGSRRLWHPQQTLSPRLLPETFAARERLALQRACVTLASSRVVCIA